jgi:hypothetical protein
MASLAKDLSFGIKEEARLLSRLRSIFGNKLQRQYGYASMDYKCRDKPLYVELKTRRICHDKYPTALISAHKIDFCKNSNSECYFVYKYTDGIYYIKYDKELFASFKTEYYGRNESPDMIVKDKLTTFIPVSYLKPIPNYIETSSLIVNFSD